MPKGAGLLAIIGGAPKGESAEGGESSSVEESGKEMALRDMFSAMKSGDFAAAAEAFQRAYDECSMDPAEEPEV